MLFTTSWDDGHPLDLRLAALMAKNNIQGTFYCPLRNVEGLPVMGPMQLRELDQQFELGSHTLDHAYANTLSAPAWAAQVRDGKAALENALGHAVPGFCYPGGKIEPGSRAAVVDAGFKFARTTVNFCVNRPTDALCLPTALQFYPHSRRVLARNLLRKGNWSDRGAVAALCLRSTDLVTRIETLLLKQAQQDAVVHLWGHSWEIEALNLWPALERVFKLVNDTVPIASRLTNHHMLQRCGLL
jgi:peptidoglycan-N-acetylglucosamine deacetylase